MAQGSCSCECALRLVRLYPPRRGLANGRFSHPAGGCYIPPKEKTWGGMGDWSMAAVSLQLAHASERFRAFLVPGRIVLVVLRRLYLFTLDDGLRPGELEGGDLITHQYAQVQGRPSNAPGYPLYTMGGWLWFRLGRLILGRSAQPDPDPVQLLDAVGAGRAVAAVPADPGSDPRQGQPHADSAGGVQNDKSAAGRSRRSSRPSTASPISSGITRSPPSNTHRRWRGRWRSCCWRSAGNGSAATATCWRSPS